VNNTNIILSRNRVIKGGVRFFNALFLSYIWEYHRT